MAQRTPRGPIPNTFPYLNHVAEAALWCTALPARTTPNFSRRGVPGRRGAAVAGSAVVPCPKLRTFVVVVGCPARSLTAVGPRAGSQGLGAWVLDVVEVERSSKRERGGGDPAAIGGPAAIAGHVRRQRELAATTWSRGS